MRNRRLSRRVFDHFDTVTRPNLAPTGAHCTIAALPPYAGGSWQWDAAAKAHHITLNSTLSNTNNKGGSLLAYYRAVANHETAHALFTERDSAKLRAIGNPYLVNIFEDARVEHLWRKSRNASTGKVRPRFRWFNYNQFCTVDQGQTDAASILLDYIVCDGSRPVFEMVKSHLAMKGIASLGERVLEYYRRILKCKATADLKPVIKDWLAEFGAASSPAPSPGTHGGTASSAASGGSGGITAPAGAGPSTPVGGGGSAHYVPTPPDRTHCKPCMYVPTKGGATWKDTPDNHAKAERVVHAMNAAFRVGEMTRYTQAPTGRISVRHVIANLPCIYRKHIHTGSDAPMKIRLIIDTSGSMDNPTQAELGGFIEGLCAMNESGRVKLDMWLSGNGSNSHIENPRREDANYIYCGGGNEYIHGTMRDSNKWKPATEYDAVVVVTDGQITDGSVKREDFSNQNNTLCVYVPNGEIQKDILDRMTAQFPHAIYRNDAVSLANSVAAELSAWRASGMMAKH